MGPDHRRHGSAGYDGGPADRRELLGPQLGHESLVRSALMEAPLRHNVLDHDGQEHEKEHVQDAQ
jgi:hypothetical protein